MLANACDSIRARVANATRRNARPTRPTSQSVAMKSPAPFVGGQPLGPSTTTLQTAASAELDG